ncbi:pyridoxal 5'-phosphate synthase glutaminase subunit PdxT [Corynebacterium bovis]|uniref:Pyridoxal 5'-phosphate synthase subunit PdxT n=1 Tax=Corynebacterium bovis TaxID=36808 RepID=A0A426Q6X2_9CORY|nr:pyridoxal 5'-phosphate synthase glutaminase subunit PdxT [Corynebacterium bovis]RRO93299.1 pyridoxal 5'-phosphate synthase glutaminase subunit PdxT [Corynebacterium bovis]RRO98338.1 pyridoxal 5'-phosphate synthase glutaminase subunit PdxT [Corynebacterium bovis]RRQ00186.1 pyridoxal 5'-phosphate synthase glutaminase subunit PdxT [Corynebacterium bovis]RRQ01105.1 pyridoxal 5'-phosphate synthase glutaminase subunit PdxT [Corynebacterium bovis]RRQ04728.1 pyridoxal 5'-phosphate synthase glutamin
MSAPVIGVLAVQGGVREHLRVLERLGATAVEVRRTAHLEGLDGIVLPGGESTTMSTLLTVGGMFEPLRDALAAGLPAFGTCAGLIMLSREVLDTRPDARSLGALDIAVRRNAFGRQVASFETDLDVSGVDDPVHAVFIRAPWVERVGDDVEVLARVTDGPADGAVVAVRQGVVLGISFHPELTEDDRMHRYFLDIVAGTR